MKKRAIVTFNNERKDIVLIEESKSELNEVITYQINTLIELQEKINEKDKNKIDSNEVKDTVFKTEYFLFKLKSIL